MAIHSEVRVKITDDISGAKGAETVRFAFEGKSYEIDLTPGNRRALEKSLTKYIEAARPTPPKNALVNGVRHRVARTAVREWARANGHDIGSKGRISAVVMDAYAASLAGESSS